MQGIEQLGLKLLKRINMGLELRDIECRARILALGNIGQFPLPRFLGDLPADIAFQGVAGQDDLGAARIVQQRVQYAWVMIMEIAKATEAVGLGPDRIDKRQGVFIPHVAAHA